MSELVNTLAWLRREVRGAAITLQLEGDHLRLTGPAGSSRLRIVPLYRPSSADVERAGSPDVLLVLTAATPRAVEAASRHNHLIVPGTGCRIIVPGIAIVHDSPPAPIEISRQVRLAGRTGVVAETLLLGGMREWAVRELASAAGASPALAHRVLTRLEREGLLTSVGHGPGKTRTLGNRRALLELWGQEERPPHPILRGFLYAASTEALAGRLLEICPNGAVGGVLAANIYRPTLTRVPPPIRIWMPNEFDPDVLTTIGFERTDAGANVEIAQSKDDPWQAHMRSDGLPRVSQWRSWIEVASLDGRTRELADALLSDME